MSSKGFTKTPPLPGFYILRGAGIITCKRSKRKHGLSRGLKKSGPGAIRRQDLRIRKKRGALKSQKFRIIVGPEKGGPSASKNYHSGDGTKDGGRSILNYL